VLRYLSRYTHRVAISNSRRRARNSDRDVNCFTQPSRGELQYASTCLDYIFAGIRQWSAVCHLGGARQEHRRLTRGGGLPRCECRLKVCNAMSKFVELPLDQYSPTAFGAFDTAADGFTIGNARALMWLSQLAYEANRQPTIGQVGALWFFDSIIPFIRHKIGLAESFETCGIVGERADAVFLAFAGTDPAVWETPATNFRFVPQPDTNPHAGFQAALEGAKDEIDEALDRSRQSGKPLFIAGHSLGGALAALAAKYADSEGVSPRGVYVFGMPRAGGENFRDAYNAGLGPVTYRLVHGLDVVARIPPSGIGFRPVGRVLQCDDGEKFDSTALSTDFSDEPAFSLGLAPRWRAGLRVSCRGTSCRDRGPARSGPFSDFFRGRSATICRIATMRRWRDGERIAAHVRGWLE
jgi:triacylglycerol lipase